jgi:hypothetical protein
MITRENLEEKLWNGVRLNEKQTEELIQDLISGLNRFPEASDTWTCSGDTLVATSRQRLDGQESPIFFICKIQKCLMTKGTVASVPALMGSIRLGAVSLAGGIFVEKSLRKYWNERKGKGNGVKGEDGLEYV